MLIQTVNLFPMLLMNKRKSSGLIKLPRGTPDCSAGHDMYPSRSTVFFKLFFFIQFAVNLSIPICLSWCNIER